MPSFSPPIASEASDSPTRGWVVLMGWGPCTLSCVIGALSVVHDTPRQTLFDLLLWLAYSAAALPFAWLLGSEWRARHRPAFTIGILASASFVLALAVTVPQYQAAIFLDLVKPGAPWLATVIRMQGCWFLLLVFAAAYFGFCYGALARRQSARLQEATLLARDAELTALRYQLQPHFLFNALNAISTLVVEGHAEQATRVVARLGDFLRLTLAGDGRHEVSLAEELDALSSYLDMERTRLGDRLAVTIQTGMGVLDCRVPWLVLQPLLENAIRHGIATRPEGGKVSVVATRECEELRIAVQSTGAWQVRTIDLDEQPSIGLANVRGRLARLYGDRGRLDIDSGTDEVTVTLRLPVQNLSGSSTP